MLHRVARDGEQLPKGWEYPIPDAIWPEALISAVRADVGALAVPRAIDTIRRWKDEALSASEPRVQREAKKWLRALADALVSEDVSDPRAASFDADGMLSGAHDSSVRDAFTMDPVRIPDHPPTKPERDGRRPPESTAQAKLSDRPLLTIRPSNRMATAATPAGEMMVDDDAILNEEPASIASRIDQLSREIAQAEGRTVSPEFTDEDDKPTTLRKARGFYRAARIDPFSEDDERPTASIAIPEDMQRRNAGQAAAKDAPIVPEDETNAKDRRNTERPSKGDDEDSVHEELPEERTVASNDGPKAMPSGAPPPLPKTPTAPPPAGPKPSSGSTPPLSKSTEDNESSRLAPKPGIVRRRAVSRKRESHVRPRAAMQQVKALHAVVLPLCEELIPLSVERRSRRFWARWREVAGERGVRRDFIEDLLQSANDVRTMVCELIAEVQTVDVKSVYALVQRIETSAQNAGTGQPAGTPERQRGPMVGVSVRVEGLNPKDEE
jgi:hypothetical protein